MSQISLQTSNLFPLTPKQKAFLLLNQSAPESGVYHVLFSARIVSEVDISALRKAVSTLVDRHPILRTTYRIHEGKSVQQIHPHPKIDFDEIDASNWTEEQLNQSLIQTIRRPFNLEQDPVLRIHLFTRSKIDRIFVLNIHHIAADIWARELILDELALIYGIETGNIQADIPPRPEKQYLDFMEWQTQMLASPKGERHGQYWQQQLAGDLPLLNLPLDKPRPPVQIYNSGYHSFHLSPDLAQQLKSLAKAEGATLYMVLLAAFFVLLYRYTNQEDISISSLASGRTKNEFLRIVGDLSNFVTLRADLSNDPPFTSFLTQIRQKVAGALIHQDYPFTLLANRFAKKGDRNASSIYQVTFNMPQANTPGAKERLALNLLENPNTQINFGGLKLEPFSLKQNLAEAVDLGLSVWEIDESLVCIWGYNTDLLTDATIANMARNYQTLLFGLVANPDRTISTSDLDWIDHQVKSRLPEIEDIPQPTPAEFTSPRNEIEFRLRQIWTRTLGVKNISIHDNFFDLGGNSLLAVSLLTKVEAKFGQTLPISALLAAPTIEAFARQLTLPDWVASSRSLVPLKPTGSKIPFFYMHPRSGNVVLYAHLARYLDPERPMYGLQAVGLNGEREPLTSIEEMAAHYIQEIQTIQPKGPYLLGGRCLGGTIALEVAQQLLAQGQQVLLVVLIESPRSGMNDPVLAQRIKNNIDKMRELDSHQAHSFQQVMNANDQAGRAYQPRVYPGRMAYFYAEETWNQPSLGFGWAKLALGGLTIYKVPGNHTSIDEYPQIQVFANKLSLCLDWAQIQPEMPNLYEMLSYLQHQQGDLDGATRNCKQFVDLEPQNPWAYRNLGDLLMQQEQFEAAIDAYQKARNLQPENLIHSSCLIKALLRKGEVDRAIAICHQTLELTPDYPDLYCHLGVAYRQKGEIEDAIASFQKAIQLDSKSVFAYRNLGEIFVQQEQLSEAITLYQSAIDSISNHPSLYVSLGNFQKKTGNLDEAIASYQQALELSPHPNVSIYRNLGDVWQQKGQISEAISAYQKAISIQPERSELYRLLGNSQAEQGDSKGAIDSYQKAIALNPQQTFIIYKKLGDLLSQQNQREAAIEAYQEALKLQPKNPQVRKALDKLESGETIS
jgi:tetratricopeptide (TPR) repeat protein/acyl carrier protein